MPATDFVYVDEPLFPFRGSLYCHLWADDIDVLHAFAVGVLGLKRAWFQEPPKASWRHYDVSENKRRVAIQRGAIAVDRYTALEWTYDRLGLQHRNADVWAGIRQRREERITNFIV